MSLCQIVDDQDTIIGYKERSQIEHPKDCYRAAGLWLTNSKGQILIAQRHMSKDKHPGKWGPAAAGTLEKGETYESNIYKEAEEELGLSGITLEIGPKMKFERPHQHFTQWFSGVCDWPEERFVPQPTEVQRVMWIEKELLIQNIREHPEKYVPSMPFIIKYYQ